MKTNPLKFHHCPREQNVAGEKAPADGPSMKTEPPPHRIIPNQEPVGEWPTTDLRCFACGKPGNLASECPDKEAKARNDAYLASQPSRPVGRSQPAENADRA
jgi:hypothetical protein